MVIQTDAHLRVALLCLLFAFQNSTYDYASPQAIKMVELIESLGCRAWRSGQVSEGAWTRAESIVKAFSAESLDLRIVNIWITQLLDEELAESLMKR